MDLASSELNAAKRTKYFQQASKLMANDVPTVPLYTRPNPLIYKSAIAGMKNNPSVIGFTWNAEDWRWKS
jgi:ABC-type transport system substrate-binding protein